jgi:uncharacterized protein (DUF2141 family)
MLLAGLCCGTAGAARAGTGTGDIVVSIQGLGSTRGIVRWALYPSEEAFSNAVHDEGNAPVRSGTCRPREELCRFTIRRLPYGDYALLLFHDENGNNKVDKRFLGLPKERAGISNYTSRPSRKPVWRRARFTHDHARSPLTIRTFR